MPPTHDRLIADLDDVPLNGSPSGTDYNWGPSVVAGTPPDKKKKRKKKKYVDASPPEPEAAPVVEEQGDDVVPGEDLAGVSLRGGLGEAVVEPPEEQYGSFDQTFSGHVPSQAKHDLDNIWNGFGVEEEESVAEPPRTIQRWTSATSPHVISQPPDPPAKAHPPPPPSIPFPRPAPVRPATTNRGTPPSRPTSLYSAQTSLYSAPPTITQQNTFRPVHNNTTQTRRESRSSPAQRFVEPMAPPHMAQPHLYGLPDLSFISSKKKDPEVKLAGSGAYCCCFDSFTDSGDLASAKRAKTALLVGSEGGLEVYRVMTNKVEVVGRLEGLRGGVVGAKILPCTEEDDRLRLQSPLVAVVVHGLQDAGHDDPVIRYQTTVEVYSLQTQEHVATLFKSNAVVVEQPTMAHFSSLPAPIGDLRVAAEGYFVTVASGKSGEIFVFTHRPTASNPESHFRCIGKTWTSLQAYPERPSSREGGGASEEVDRKPGVPLFSLSQRWLAIVAPASSSHISVQGTALLSDHNPSAPGLASHVAPPQPSITCDLAGVDVEGTLSRITRQTAQGLVHYTQKGFEMGWQGWNELVNPTNQATQQHTRTTSRDDFPPTKAPPDDPGRYAKEPAVVCVVDLEALISAEELRSKNPPAPMATFSLEEGCNFLSLSSTGLRLLTVSHSGEASFVWDLKQASHGAVHYAQPDNMTTDAFHGPCVKQVVRIPRASHAVAVESAWSRDDEYIAVLTNHGTIHLHEVPLQPRSPSKRKRPRPSADKAAATTSVSTGVSPPSSTNLLGAFTSTLSSWSISRPSLDPVTSVGIPTTFAGLRNVAASASHASSRALARGISQSYTAARTGAVDYLHADDNKIRLVKPQDSAAMSSTSLRWVKRQSGMILAVATSGVVQLHPITRIERVGRDGEAISSLKHDKHGKKNFDLPPIRTDHGRNTATARADAESCARAGPHGFWSLRLSEGEENEARRKRSQAVMQQQVNDVETNPPYCPFHVDARVNILAVDDGSSASAVLIRGAASTVQGAEQYLSQGFMDDAVWVFGGSLPNTKQMNSHEQLPRKEFGDDGIEDAEMEALAKQVESRCSVGASGDGGEEIRVHSRQLQRGEWEEWDEDEEED